MGRSYASSQFFQAEGNRPSTLWRKPRSLEPSDARAPILGAGLGDRVRPGRPRPRLRRLAKGSRHQPYSPGEPRLRSGGRTARGEPRRPHPSRRAGDAGLRYPPGEAYGPDSLRRGGGSHPVLPPGEARRVAGGPGGLDRGQGADAQSPAGQSAAYTLAAQPRISGDAPRSGYIGLHSRERRILRPRLACSPAAPFP